MHSARGDEHGSGSPEMRHQQYTHILHVGHTIRTMFEPAQHWSVAGDCRARRPLRRATTLGTVETVPPRRLLTARACVHWELSPSASTARQRLAEIDRTPYHVTGRGTTAVGSIITHAKYGPCRHPSSYADR